MTDDFRLPPDHPILVDARRRRDEAEARLKALLERLTTYARPKATLIAGVSLALFVRDNPAAGSVQDDELYPDPTGDELLALLGYVPEVRREVEADERALIEGARRRGKTWQEIGEVLGYKASGARQGARQRYARLGGKAAELDKQLEAGEANHE